MNPEQFRHEFLSRIGGLGPFQQLLDLLPDVAFFIKDRAGRFVMQNRRSCEYCRVASDIETLGKTDYDFFPSDRARMYVESDQQVMNTGVPVINAIAPAPEESGSERLIVYSKVPLRDQEGNVIGIMGIHREIEGTRAAPKSYGALSRALRHIHTHYNQPMSTRQLAEMVGISPSQFERRFRKLFGAAPRVYLLRVRINAAARMLAETDMSVTEIALESGFYDHSHFSRTFSKLMGVSPFAYRKRHVPE